MPFVSKSSYTDRLTHLSPKETMERNELCWCNSGRKWKKCHYLRATEDKYTESRLMHEFHSQAKTAVCLHADAPKNCSHKIVRAHTVQKSGSLSAIVERGHVYSGRDNSLIKKSGHKNTNLALVGVNSASTFSGFCSFHDNFTFKPADSATTVTKEVAFLLAYRALAYEVYMKMITIPTMEALRNKIDRGLDYVGQARAQVSFHLALQGFQAGLVEHRVHKINYDRLLGGLWQSDFHVAAFSFDGILPIVSSGTFFPEFDFHGNTLQDIDNDIGHLSLLAFNLVVIGRKSVLIFGWDFDPTGSNFKFVESFAALQTSRMADAVVRFCFEICDNIFARPSWWDLVSKPDQNDLLRRLRQNIPGSHASDGLTIGKNTSYVAEKIIGERINL